MMNKNIIFKLKYKISTSLIIQFIIIFIPLGLADLGTDNFTQNINNNNEFNYMNKKDRFNQDYIDELEYKKKIYQNTITLVIKGEVNQPIINKEIIEPEIIFVNNNKIQTKNYEKVYNLNKEENTIILKWNDPLVSCKEMFNNTNNIISIDFSKFDTSKVSDMSYMFNGCSQLKYINFTNFKTSGVKNMEYMFCNTGLTSLDLSKFNTRSVTNMDNMFNNATSLLSLDLSNFDTSSVTSMKNMFDGCNSLIYINLISFEEKSDVDISNIFLIYFQMI